MARKTKSFLKMALVKKQEINIDFEKAYVLSSFFWGTLGVRYFKKSAVNLIPRAKGK